VILTISRSPGRDSYLFPLLVVEELGGDLLDQNTKAVDTELSARISSLLMPGNSELNS
jgi:hypothetical protein